VILVAAEVGAVMRHIMVSRKLWCWQQWWLLRQRRRIQQKGSGNHGMEGVLVQKFIGKNVVVKISIWQRLFLGYETCYQVFELATKATKHI